MLKKTLITLMALIVTSTFCFAGGWDENKGMNRMTLNGELVCIGCSLKKMDGANAQCNLYAHHAIGFKAADGTLWSIVDNAKGHDVIRAHTLLGHRKATISGWIFPSAHFIEIAEITVDGVTEAQIRKAGLEEDHLVAKRLSTRKPGEAPGMEHKH